MPGTIVAQLSRDFSICSDRRPASRPRRSETRTISGARLSSWLVVFETAMAAAGSIPVHNPTKYVVDEGFASKAESSFSPRLYWKSRISLEFREAGGEIHISIKPNWAMQRRTVVTASSGLLLFEYVSAKLRIESKEGNNERSGFSESAISCRTALYVFRKKT